MSCRNRYRPASLRTPFTTEWLVRVCLVTWLWLGTLAAGCAKPATEASGSVSLVESVTLAVPATASDLRGTAPARAGSGAFAALTNAGRGGGIAVFDSSGRFLAELTAQGRGPGEFSDLVSVGFGPGDTVWAVERTRAQAFAPVPSLRFVRTVDFGAAASSEVTPYGFLARGSFGSSGPQPPALRGWDGSIVVTFAPPSSASGEEAPMGPVTALSADTVWFGHGQRYELWRLSASGKSGSRIRRALDWFPPDARYAGALNVVRPPARLQFLRVDDDGRLLVLSRRAHREWTPMAPRAQQSSGPVEARGRGSLAEMNRLFEYVLEIFSADGALVASLDLDDGMQGLVDGATVYQVAADSMGLISLRLWGIRVSDSAVAPR
jgi:hypothetical protein